MTQTHYSLNSMIGEYIANCAKAEHPLSRTQIEILGNTARGAATRITAMLTGEPGLEQTLVGDKGDGREVTSIEPVPLDTRTREYVFD